MAGVYEQYKRATDSFLTWLKDAAGARPMRSSREIWKSAQAVKATGKQMPSDAWAALGKAIALRSQLHQILFGAGKADDEHLHFIRLLRSVRDVLRAQPAEARADGRSGEPERAREAKTGRDESRIGNKFQELSIEGEGSSGDAEGAAVDTEAEALPAWLSDSLGDESTSATLAELRGENLFFQAAGLLLDLHAIVKEVDRAWSDFKGGRCDHQTATALSNVCVRHAERVTAQAELEWPELDTVPHILTAALLMPEVLGVQREFGCKTNVALAVVSDTVFGDPKSTKLTRSSETLPNWMSVQAFVLPHLLMNPVMMMGAGVDPATFARAAANARKGLGRKCSDDRAMKLVEELSMKATSKFGPKDAGADDLEPGEVELDVDPADPLFGEDGVFYTADFMRALSAARIVNPRQSVWSLPKPGFFGPEWDEESYPASTTADMNDYTASSIPALLQVVKAEAKSPYREIFHVSDLMPLWPLLEKAARRNKLTAAMIFGFHLINLSLVRVNGGRRCKRMHVTCSVAIKMMLRDANEAADAFDGIPARNKQVAVGNMKPVKEWLERESGIVAEFKRLGLSGENPGITPQEFESIVDRQVNNALALNPYVAGQRLLVVKLGCGLAAGVHLVDCAAQLSIALHLYNAMRIVGAIERLDRLDVLMKAIGNNPAVWFAGVPSDNFAKHWLHRMGMSSDLKTNRALSSLEAEDISPAYKVAVKHPSSNLEVAFDADPFLAELDCVRSAFAKDKVRHWNLVSLGAQLMRLPERLVDALGLHAHVETCAARHQEHYEEDPKRGRRKPGKEYNVAENTRWAGVLMSLVDTIMMWCEFKVPDKSAPFHLPPGLSDKMDGVSRHELPPLTPEKEGKLALAAETMASFIKDLKL